MYTGTVPLVPNPPGGHVWHGHGLSQLAIGIVVRRGWVGLDGDGGRHRGRILLSPGGGRGARVGTVGGDASRGTVDQRRGCTGLIPTGWLSLDGRDANNICSWVRCKWDGYGRAGKYPEGLHLDVWSLLVHSSPGTWLLL
jgi:hypothetical protein